MCSPKKLNIIKNLFILVGGDCNELGLDKRKRAEAVVSHLEEVAGTDQVKTRLILVHRVQDCLK